MGEKRAFEFPILCAVGRDAVPLDARPRHLAPYLGRRSQSQTFYTAAAALTRLALLVERRCVDKTTHPHHFDEENCHGRPM
jgi:hypothetical protein